METNQNPVQGQPAQLIISETTLPVQPEQPSIPVFDRQPEPPTVHQTLPTPEKALLYDPEKAARIAECLRELFDPAYILLFGTLAGGTPHSDTFTYDLLVITDDKPAYNWYDAKRYLKMKMPNVCHGVPYMNIYVHTLHDVEANFTPFIYLTRREGIVLYRSCRRKFKRPRMTFDFGHAAAVAKKYSGVFLPLADRLTLHAEKMTDRMSIRQSAFLTAQATVYYFRTLFYVYHGFEADTFDVEILQHRLRTLSGELPLLFESDSYNSIYTIPCLKSFLVNARYNPDFFIHPEELEQHLGRVKRLGIVTNKLCVQRIALYESRAE